MKRTNVWLTLLLLPLLAYAGPYGGNPYGGGMGPDQQRMMEAVRKMQACMQSIDQSKLLALRQRGERLQTELKRLCAAGKRAQAQRRAIAYGIEMSNSPVLKKIKQCTSYMKGVMPGGGMGQGADAPYEGQPSDKNAPHVCDSDLD